MNASRKYGPHKYAGNDVTSDCEYGCRCWAGPSRSGGPLGLDPLSGACPNNPEDGQRLPGNQDYEAVVNQRIADLSQRAYRAEAALKEVSPSQQELAQEIRQLKKELGFFRDFFRKLREAQQVLQDGLRPSS